MRTKTLDYSEPMNLLIAAVEAFGSESEIRKLVDRTQGGKKTKFKNGKWIHSHVPFGYRKGANGWLETVSEKAEVVEAIFNEFIRFKNYTETARKINGDFEDVLGGKIERYKVKSVITNPVYVGRPTYGDELEVKDPSLSMVDEETFQRAQKIVEEIHEKNSGGKDEYLGKKVEELGFGYLSKKADIGAVCKKCGAVMVKSGSKVIRGMKVGQYKCSECGHESTVPLGSQMGEFEGRNLISCPYCRVTENFIVDQTLSGKYTYRCGSCGGTFVSEAEPDKYLREYPPEGEEDEQ
ncbi:hypothetical protein AKJ63_00320 [candidate division MSBL1 archaeon SCGC-AAA259D18]|uniref:Recombinase domain-containing protein n=1 Tax=candidate division MSBL1 archaeon SCGC-AAA259D18 TaxID=1698262 RepID=A0A133UCP3_9EURY|nr:hypothetical protein AKJ63_00320 [candidate division MSBL1 archaeon SCGC-AAA259D18]